MACLLSASTPRYALPPPATGTSNFLTYYRLNIFMRQVTLNNTLPLKTAPASLPAQRTSHMHACRYRAPALDCLRACVQQAETTPR